MIERSAGRRPEHLSAVAGPDPGAPADAGQLLRAVARGDERAFERLYELVASRVYGLIRRVLRDPAQAEEVAQEVLVEVWRTAARFDPARGSATAWVFTIAHRRVVDRVRAERAAAERDIRVGAVRGAELHANSASGDVMVGVPTGTKVWLDLNTVSGSTASDLQMTGEPVSDGPVATVQVRTISGDIQIRRVA